MHDNVHSPAPVPVQNSQLLSHCKRSSVQRFRTASAAQAVRLTHVPLAWCCKTAEPVATSPAAVLVSRIRVPSGICKQVEAAAEGSPAETWRL